MTNGNVIPKCNLHSILFWSFLFWIPCNGVHASQAQLILEKKSETFQKIFARYLANGRVDSPIVFHLRSSNPETKIEKNSLSGTSFCNVAELKLSTGNSNNSLSSTNSTSLTNNSNFGSIAELENSGRIIYEVSRCLVLPHLDTSFLSQLQTKQYPLSILESRVASDLVKLTVENILVARTIFSIFLKDGVFKSRSYAKYLLELQPKPETRVLSTTIAIQSSLDILNTANGPRDEAQSMSMALGLARLCAEEELLNALTPNGFESVLESEYLKTVRSEIDKALGKIGDIHLNGKFQNHSMTIRESISERSIYDRHFFVKSNGSIESTEVLGVENSFEYESLRKLVTADSSLEPKAELRGKALRSQISTSNMLSMQVAFEKIIADLLASDEQKKESIFKLIRQQVDELTLDDGVDVLLSRIGRKLRDFTSK